MEQIILDESEQSQKFRTKYYSDKGTEALRNRLNALVKLLGTKTEYPFEVKFLGFPPLICKSQEDLLGRIHELSDLLFTPVEITQ